MTTTFYQQIGAGQDLVLVHGWGAHSGVWSEIIPTLATTHRVTVIDLPGFGRSSLPKGNYDLNTVCSALLEVAPSNATWIGWSLGGLLSMAIALQAPNRVNKLITIASSPCFVAQLEWMGMAPQLLHKFAEQLRADYQATIRRFLALQFYGLEISRKAIRELEDELLNPPPKLEALVGGLHILESVDLRDQLEDINCPMIGMFGRLDAMVPVHVAEQIKQYRPDYQAIIFEQAAHIPFLTHPQQFLTQLQSVL